MEKLTPLILYHHLALKVNDKKTSGFDTGINNRIYWMLDMMEGFYYDLYVLYSQIMEDIVVVARLVATEAEVYIECFFVRDRSHTIQRADLSHRGNFVPIKTDIGEMRPIGNLYIGAEWQASFNNKRYKIIDIKCWQNADDKEIEIHFEELDCPFKLNDNFFYLFTPMTN